MNILFICHEYPPKQYGGIGSFTKLLAEGLVKNGIKVDVVGYGSDSKYSKNNENGVLVWRSPLPRKSTNKYFNHVLNVYNRLKFHLYLRKHTKLNTPDIIECHEWSGPLIFKIKGAKLVIRLHGSNTAFNENMGLKRHFSTYIFEKRVIHIADHILAVSNHIAEITQSSFNYKFNFNIIYNGVDTTVFTPQSCVRNYNKIVMVGRMHPYKGFENLFAALNELFELNKYVYFEFICTIIEEYKDRLLCMVSEEHHHRIKFIGRIPNNKLKHYYSSANLSILPSLAEAFPIIPLESMACGTPVVMSDRFSSKEIIQDDVDGFLIDVSKPNLLARQIAKILEDQQKIDQMRDVARNKILQFFSNEKILKDNMDFYKSIL